jgi:uncharacterized SAM-binding protein YcdF (DUF218 family)
LYTPIMTYFEPALPLLLLLGLAGCAWSWRLRTGHRPWLETVSLLAIAVLSMESGAWVFARPLEARYSRNPYPQGNADAIVVLSGTVVAPSAERPYVVPAEDTYLRVEHAVWLYRHWKPLPVLVSGGGSTKSVPYAMVMKRLLELEGIPSDRIWVEARSQNTHESAVYGGDVLRHHGATRAAVVTETNGMLRAALSFEKQGISVVPAPLWRDHAPRDLMDFLPGWRGISLNGGTLHEALGLAYYKLRGWI